MKSTRGGARPGAGRPKGAQTKANRELREIAKDYTSEAVEKLAVIMRTGATESAVVTAAIHILDRGHGKAPQTINANVSILDRLSAEDRAIAEGVLAAFADGEEASADGTGETAH